MTPRQDRNVMRIAPTATLLVASGGVPLALPEMFGTVCGGEA